MAKDLRGFLKIKREQAAYRPVCERKIDYELVFQLRSAEQNVDQGSRCMDCGTPFCHWACPLGNYIPEWNEQLGGKNWERSYQLLAATNNLPEITGRVCPALCEYACVLGVNDDPVTIRENELGIVEQAFKTGLIRPRLPRQRSGKRVAVVGSGPAGLACADQLNQAGHQVTVLEKAAKIGGLLRYGIPDFKLEKSILDRRLAIWEKEGIEYRTGVAVGATLSVDQLKKDYDAIVLAGGSRMPRDLKIPGRELAGIHFALDYLTQSNQRVAGEKIAADQLIDAKGKKVVVIGGGDTGSDCVGTAHRQGAACVVQIEIMPRPGDARPTHQPWPLYPNILKTSSSHQEGGERRWSVATKKFLGEEGRVKQLECCQIDGKFQEIEGSAFRLEADLVFLALGFLHPEHSGLLEQLKVEFDQRGNVKTGADYQTSVRGVFAAGDMRRGQSLVVWAIAEGRAAAAAVNQYLQS